MSDRQEIEASPLMLVACIRDCLNRLLAQDSWELPHVDKGRAALDALATSLAESAAREKTLREAVSAFLSKTADWTDDSVHSGLGPLRVALAAVPSPAAERELFKDVPRVPMCTVVTQSSWHAPVRCAYALNHPGEHSWATIPAFPPAAESCPNTYCRDGWVPFEPNESNAAPPIPCRHPDCPSRPKSSPAADGEEAEA